MILRRLVFAITLGTVPMAAMAQPLVPMVVPTVVRPNGATTLSGITVSGFGVARKAADTARFSVLFDQRAGVDTILATADKLAAALRGAGVADAATSVPDSNFIGVGNGLTVVGSLSAPTTERARAAFDAVNAAVPGPSSVQALRYSLSVTSCDDIDAAAIAAALSDARLRAQRVAKGAGLRLGSIVAISIINQSGTCPTRGVPDQRGYSFNAANGAPSFTVEDSVLATVTYSIR